jgi:hypothetical protein
MTPTQPIPQTPTTFGVPLAPAERAAFVARDLLRLG